MLRYIHTIRYLSINQIFHFFLKNPKKYLSILILKKRKFFNVENKEIKFDFYIPQYQNDFKKNINRIITKHNIWKKKFNKLFTYNIHYLDFIFDYSKNDSKEIIYSWIDENKLSFKNVAWDPYPASLRLINLIKCQLEITIFQKNY